MKKQRSGSGRENGILNPKGIRIVKDKKSSALLAAVKEEALKLFGDKLRKLIVYGSYARDESTPESDIDIMLLIDDSDAEIRKYKYKIADIMTDLSLKYDTFISITEENYNRFYEYLPALPYFRNIRDEGLEIYGSDAA